MSLGPKPYLCARCEEPRSANDFHRCDMDALAIRRRIESARNALRDAALELAEAYVGLREARTKLRGAQISGAVASPLLGCAAVFDAAVTKYLTARKAAFDGSLP